jgi:hypothetical protein
VVKAKEEEEEKKKKLFSFDSLLFTKNVSVVD